LEQVKTDMDTNTMTTKFMDMLNKRDNGLIQKILEAEDLDKDTLMDMFKAANDKYFAKLKVAGKTKKKKRGPSAWVIFGAILRETLTTIAKERDLGGATPFTVVTQWLGHMWKGTDDSPSSYDKKDEFVTKVGELNKNLLENGEVLADDEAKRIVKKLFPKKSSVKCEKVDSVDAIVIKFDKALQEKAKAVLMEKFGQIPIDEPKPKKKGAKGKKAAKDPRKPKRAKSAYIYFCSAMRATVKAELGDDAKATEVTRALGARWKQLSDEEKKPYQESADEDKKRYAREMAEYSGNSGGSGSSGEEQDVEAEVPKTPKKSKKKKVAPGAPKKKKKKSKSPVKKKAKPVEEAMDIDDLLDSSDDDE